MRKMPLFYVASGEQLRTVRFRRSPPWNTETPKSPSTSRREPDRSHLRRSYRRRALPDDPPKKGYSDVGLILVPELGQGATEKTKGWHLFFRHLFFRGPSSTCFFAGRPALVFSRAVQTAHMCSFVLLARQELLREQLYLPLKCCRARPQVAGEASGPPQLPILI